VAAGVVLLDQLSKWWAVERLTDGNIDVLWTLRFRLIGNRGSAFSLGTGLGPFFAVAAIGVAIVLVIIGRRAPTRTGAVALGLVLGGALGNLIDRIARDGDGLFGGYVVDFIDFQWWPVFNVADMAIVCGAILVVVIGTSGWDGTRS
jgi:signal peptidase II